MVLDCALDDVQINLKQAIPCGLIVNELVSNALKYAFSEQKGGTIRLRVDEKGQDIEIEVSDDGVGPVSYTHLTLPTILLV